MYFLALLTAVTAVSVNALYYYGDQPYIPYAIQRGQLLSLGQQVDGDTQCPFPHHPP